jgi:carboxyl-terminal processing protease
MKPIKESDLSRHLLNGSAKDDDKITDRLKEGRPTESLVAKDYQLGEALNLLKGLAILHRNRSS